MPDGLDDIPPPADPDVRAFVLRVRIERSETRQRRDIIDVEDVRTMRTWRLMSLEDAFEQIRRLMGHNRTRETGPPN